MMFVYPKSKDAATGSNFQFDYWTGINYGNCGSSGTELNVISEKRTLRVQQLTGTEKTYDFCHYDLLTDLNDKNTVKKMIDLKG